MTKSGICETIRQMERQIVGAFDLTQVAIDPDLSRRIGTFRGSEVTIESRQYRGGRVRLARFAVVYGETLEIGNVMCFPDPAFIVPILGADLVAVREDSVMIAADLSPISPSADDHRDQFTELQNACKNWTDLPSGGDLPEWALRLFSPFALYTRVDLSQVPNAYQALGVFPELFVRHLKAAQANSTRALEISQAQGHYADVHRADDKGLRLLGAMFGMDWAERYLREFLFPSADNPGH